MVKRGNVKVRFGRLETSTIPLSRREMVNGNFKFTPPRPVGEGAGGRGPVTRNQRVSHFPLLSFFLGSFLAAIHLLPLPAIAASSVSGDLSAFALSPSSNPHFVDGDLVVPEGKTVTIPAGCIFLFSPFTGVRVDGTLLVLGEADTPVVFTSVKDTAYNKNSMQPPEPFSWNGIVIGSDSRGSRLRHCIVSYSVYGIKSKIRDITVDNVLFHSNGQFHFTIKDSILDVKERISFSYGVRDALAHTQHSMPAAVSTPPPPPAPPVKSRPAIYKSKPFRITMLGITVLGIGAGTYYAVNAAKHQGVLEDISYSRVARDKTKWESERELKRQCVSWCAAGYAAGAVGVAGFGVSFLLPEKLALKKQK